MDIYHKEVIDIDPESTDLILDHEVDFWKDTNNVN